MTYEIEGPRPTPARYRLLRVKGATLEESLDLPTPNLGIFKQYVYLTRPTLATLGNDTLLHYDGGFGRISVGSFAWELQLDSYGYSTSYLLQQLLGATLERQ